MIAATHFSPSDSASWPRYTDTYTHYAHLTVNVDESYSETRQETSVHLLWPVVYRRDEFEWISLHGSWNCTDLRIPYYVHLPRLYNHMNSWLQPVPSSKQVHTHQRPALPWRHTFPVLGLRVLCTAIRRRVMRWLTSGSPCHVRFRGT